MKTFDMAALAIKERYGLMSRIAVPRAIALVSSVDGQGRGNLAPFSYFTLGGANPPSCVICPLNDRTGTPKDTLRNIEATKEYVINAVTLAMAEPVNQASWAYPSDVDELDEVGLHRLPSDVVAPPRVAESPVSVECRLYRVVRHGDGPLSGAYVIGEMLRIHAKEEVLDEAGLPDARKLDAVGRLGGDLYCTTRPASLFGIPRPKGP